jgi:hypothetical protein
MKEKDEKKKPKGRGNEPRVYGTPVYNVVSGGVTVEWTDKLAEASNAFRDAGARPKYLWSIDGSDSRLINALA